jgi:hypothetical protein
MTSVSAAVSIPTLADIYAEFDMGQYSNSTQIISALQMRYNIRYRTNASDIYHSLIGHRADVLRAANHRFFHEMALCCPIHYDSQEALAYVIYKLNNEYGYERRYVRSGIVHRLTKTMISQGLRNIAQSFTTDYEQMPLQEAIFVSIERRRNLTTTTTTTTTIPTSQRTPPRTAERALRALEARAEARAIVSRTFTSNAALGAENARNVEIMSSLTQISQALQSANQTSGVSASTPVDAAVNMMRMVLNNNDDNNNSESEASAVSRVEFSQQEMNYCKHNNVMCSMKWSEESQRFEKFYMSNEVVDRLVFYPPNTDGGEIECHVCLSSVGHHKCGNEKCPSSYCTRCFHEMSKIQLGSLCAFCRKPFTVA